MVVNLRIDMIEVSNGAVKIMIDGQNIIHWMKCFEHDDEF